MTDDPALERAALTVLERHGVKVDAGGLIHVPAGGTALPAELWHAIDSLCEHADYDFILESDR